MVNTSHNLPLRVYIGTDLVDVARIGRLVDRFGKRFSDLIFTDLEWQICGDNLQRLAGRYAAKEAVAKALGCGLAQVSLDGVSPLDIEVFADQHGAPLVRLIGTALTRLTVKNIVDVQVSISHLQTIAVATAVAVEVSN